MEPVGGDCDESLANCHRPLPECVGTMSDDSTHVLQDGAAVEYEAVEETPSECATSRSFDGWSVDASGRLVCPTAIDEIEYGWGSEADLPYRPLPGLVWSPTAGDGRAYCPEQESQPDWVAEQMADHSSRSSFGAGYVEGSDRPLCTTATEDELELSQSSDTDFPHDTLPGSVQGAAVADSTVPDLEQTSQVMSDTPEHGQDVFADWYVDASGRLACLGAKATEDEILRGSDTDLPHNHLPRCAWEAMGDDDLAAYTKQAHVVEEVLRSTLTTSSEQPGAVGSSEATNSTHLSSLSSGLTPGASSGMRRTTASTVVCQQLRNA